MNRHTAFEPRSLPLTGRGTVRETTGLFERAFLQQFLAAVRPEIKTLIKEVIADEEDRPLVVDYEQAGRMIGITYEGIRKLVRRGRLTAVSRSGRHRGIAVEELKDYVRRSQIGREPEILVLTAGRS